MNYFKAISLSLLMMLFFAQCSSCERGSKNDKHLTSTYREWESILQSDTLKVGTMTSPTDFYIMRDQSFGFEYQKISDFTTKHGLTLDVKISYSIDSLLSWLREGQIDLCITPLPQTKTNQTEYLFAGLSNMSSLVLVQRKSEHMVSYIADLAGKSVYAESNSAAELRLKQIQQEIGRKINVITSDTLMSEDLLVLMNSIDSIQYVVSDKRSARVISHYYPKLNSSLSLSAPVKHGWVVNNKNNSLKEALDDFFCTSKKKKHYEELLKEDSHLQRFFKSEQGYTSYRPMKNGEISPYDSIFQKEAVRLGWHWTYLAAIAFHESTFRSDIVAWSGARGLMGIMPSTGAAYGANRKQLLDPNVSVRVAVDCLLEYGSKYKTLPNELDQICFTLASYNAGSGHILDAIRLANKYNAPVDRWYGGIREYVILKSNPNYYNDPVVRFGYMRGRETADYVDNIIERQEYYKSIAKVK